MATNDVLRDANQVQVATLEIWPPDEFVPIKIPARTTDGLTFCGGFGLNPLQIQSHPTNG